MVLQFTRNCPIPIQFQPGDLVWLEGRNLKIHHPTHKLAPRRYGPFPIKARLSPVVYRLTLPPSMKIHPTFHIDLLSPFVETASHSPNYMRPPPEIIEGEEEWEVDKVLQSRHFGRTKTLQYLVRWKGFPPSKDSWVPESDITAPDLITDFHL